MPYYPGAYVPSQLQHTIYEYLIYDTLSMAHNYMETIIPNLYNVQCTWHKGIRNPLLHEMLQKFILQLLDYISTFKTNKDTSHW